MKNVSLIIIALVYSVMVFGQQVSKTVNVTNAGTLNSLITVNEALTITNLTITGNIDARDFAYMRDYMKVLSVLVMTSAKIKTYNGISGTYAGLSLVYQANEIPMYSFYNANTSTYNSSITSVTLPTTTTSIGYLAFYYCWNISGTFAIPASVKSIGDYALYGCTKISEYSVEAGNSRYASNNGVLQSKNLDSIFICPTAKTGAYTIPQTVTWIGPSAFEGCSQLTGNLILPSSLLTISNYAFYYCSGFTGDLTIPSTVTSIGTNAFYACSGLNGTVSIPKTVNSIGTNAFLLCDNIKSYAVEGTNTKYASIDGILYSKIIDTLLICPGAKSGSITIPSTVKAIKNYAFYNCSTITGVINISSQINIIGDYAFMGCKQISSFNVDALNHNYSSADDVLFTKNKSRLLACPAAKSGSYSVPPTVITIDPSAFCYCSNLTGELSIPATVNTIGDYAFYGCSQITGFNVDGSNKIFSSQNGLLFNKAKDSLYICPLSKTGSYEIPTSVSYIGYSAFDGCNLLTDITIPSSVKMVDKYAFEYCTGLTKVHISKNVSTIGSAAFYNCTNLQKVEIERTTPPVIDYYTFDLVNKSTCTLVVPVNSALLYSNANYWKSFILITESTFQDTKTKELSIDNIKIFSQKQNIYIDGLSVGEKIDIFTMNGKHVYQTISDGNMFCYSNAKDKLYLIRISGKNYKVIR